MNPPRSSPTRRAPRGSAYLAVLGGSLLITVIGLGAMSAAASRRAAAELEVSAWKARLNAQSGIDLALRAIAADTNWRSTFSAGSVIPSTSTGDGTVSVTAEDPADASLSDDNTEPFNLISTGAHGIARHALQVRVASTAPALSCLGVALASAGAHTHTGTTLVSNQTIASNLAVVATLATISGRVEAGTLVSGVTYSGTTASAQPLREFPNSSVISTYAALGSTISWASIPTVSSKKRLQNLLISAACPPLGAVSSAAAIYVIDCAGNDLIIENCRIVGTLVLRNAGSGTIIQNAVNWSEGSPGYPILLVEGSATIGFNSAAPLSEASLALNLNPSGTPYSGSTDADTADSYPSEMRGLVYISGSLTTSSSPKIVGCTVVGGGLSTSGTLTLEYNPAFASSPPQGFTGTPSLAIVPGTWQRVVK